MEECPKILSFYFILYKCPIYVQKTHYHVRILNLRCCVLVNVLRDKNVTLKFEGLRNLSNNVTKSISKFCHYLPLAQGENKYQRKVRHCIGKN